MSTVTANGKGTTKKKKKANFSRRVKKYAKRGKFGRGKELSEEQYNYYMRVFEHMKQTEGEEKDTLIHNFFREFTCEVNAKNLVCNQIVSHILEQALHNAHASEALKLANVIGEDLRAMCVDAFASHVLQTLMDVLFKYVQQSATEKKFEENEETKEVVETEVLVSKGTRNACINYLNKICKFVSNNVNEFILDTYASHIICSVLMVCSGVDVKDTIKSKRKNSHGLSKIEKEVKVPDPLKPILEDLTMKFTMLPNVTDIITNNCSSVVAQTLLLVLWNTEAALCEKVRSHVLKYGFNEMNTPLFQNNAAARLLEILVTCSDSETQKKVFDRYCKGNIAELIECRQANFTVQSLLASWRNKENFQDFYTETSEALETAVSANHTGVVHSFAQACFRLSFPKCIHALMELLDCKDQDRKVQFAPLLLGLVKYDEFQQRKSEGTPLKISLHGALTVQELLKFNKPSSIVKSLLEMSTDDLAMIACDMRGTHVISSYFASSFVGSKNWEKMIQKFKGKFTTMACCKYGSRSLDDMRKVANIDMKTFICNELVKDSSKLKEDQYGKYIHSSFMLSLFGRNNQLDWQEVITKQEKKRKQFDDILKDADEVIKKQKTSQVK